MKIERHFASPAHLLSQELLFLRFRIRGFMLYKQYWKEWLNAAKHIWAHLDWIAHGEAELLGES